MSSLRKDLGEEDLTINADLDETNVESVHQEFEYWKRMESSASTPENKKKALFFQGCYKEVEPLWKEIESLSHK